MTGTVKTSDAANGFPQPDGPPAGRLPATARVPGPAAARARERAAQPRVTVARAPAERRLPGTGAPRRPPSRRRTPRTSRSAVKRAP